MTSLTRDESSILRKIRQLSPQQRDQLARTIEEMREAQQAAVQRQRLASFEKAFGAWSSMTDEEAEALWQEIHAMRGVEEDDVPS